MHLPSLAGLSAVGRRLGLGTSHEDAIQLLKKDHAKVETLFAQYGKARSARDKGRIAANICKELKIHTRIEEKVFYPAARDHLRHELMIDEAVVEHAHIKELVADLEARTPDDDLYDADMKVLMDYVKHHVKEEERELFPKLRSTDMDMERVGARIAAMKTRIMRRANGGAPARMNGASPRRKAAKPRAKHGATRRARKTRH
jgi:hemerythrin superfamily protein